MNENRLVEGFAFVADRYIDLRTNHTFYKYIWQFGRIQYAKYTQRQPQEMRIALLAVNTLV